MKKIDLATTPTKATAPCNYDPGKGGHITPGKTYDIKRYGCSPGVFWIDCDDGFEIYCLERECAHIGCLDWVMS
jgi:hypothetical protein